MRRAKDTILHKDMLTTVTLLVLAVRQLPVREGHGEYAQQVVLHLAVNGGGFIHGVGNQRVCGVAG